MLRAVLTSLQEGEDSSSYIPADSTFSHRRTLEIIVTTFGSIRVIRLSSDFEAHPINSNT